MTQMFLQEKFKVKNYMSIFQKINNDHCSMTKLKGEELRERVKHLWKQPLELSKIFSSLMTMMMTKTTITTITTITMTTITTITINDDNNDEDNDDDNDNFR